jgi:hypothetical protein
MAQAFSKGLKSLYLRVPCETFSPNRSASSTLYLPGTTCRGMPSMMTWSG